MITLKVWKEKGTITEKELKYFTVNHKKDPNLGKMYFLLKIQKKLYSFPERPVISNCGTPTEKIREFLDNEVKFIMKEGLLYIKDYNDFILQIKEVGVVDLYSRFIYLMK